MDFCRTKAKEHEETSLPTALDVLRRAKIQPLTVDTLKEYIRETPQLQFLLDTSMELILEQLQTRIKLLQLRNDENPSVVSIVDKRGKGKRKKTPTDEVFNMFLYDRTCLMELAINKIKEAIGKEISEDYIKITGVGTRNNADVVKRIQKSADVFVKHNKFLFDKQKNASVNTDLFLRLMYYVRRGFVRHNCIANDSTISSISILWVEIGKFAHFILIINAAFL